MKASVTSWASAFLKRTYESVAGFRRKRSSFTAGGGSSLKRSSYSGSDFKIKAGGPSTQSRRSESRVTAWSCLTRDRCPFFYTLARKMQNSSLLGVSPPFPLSFGNKIPSPPPPPTFWTCTPTCLFCNNMFSKREVKLYDGIWRGATSFSSLFLQLLQLFQLFTFQLHVIKLGV